MDEVELDRALAIAELLSGAAASDTDVAGVEVARVIAVLEELVGTPLHEAVVAKVDAFDATTFDLEAVVARLAGEADVTREMILHAVVEIAVADRYVDSSELGFIARVAAGLGLPVPDVA